MVRFRRATKEVEIKRLIELLNEKREAVKSSLKWSRIDRDQGRVFVSGIREMDAHYYARQVQRIIKRLEALGVDTKKLFRE